MKKYVIASILLISSLTSVAEDHYSGAFSIGAKGGVSLSQTTFSPSVPQKFHSGPMAGIPIYRRESFRAYWRGEFRATRMERKF